jgi:hypothetical protein
VIPSVRGGHDGDSDHRDRGAGQSDGEFAARTTTSSSTRRALIPAVCPRRPILNPVCQAAMAVRMCPSS